jgi:hypothetical protein
LFSKLPKKYEKEPFAVANFGSWLGNMKYEKAAIWGCKFWKLFRKLKKTAICGCKFWKMTRKYEKAAI